jgi:TRAP-type C4-dicarboxylate transport system permease small subunit
MVVETSKVEKGEGAFSLQSLIDKLTRITRWLSISGAFVVCVVMMLGVLDVVATKAFNRPILGLTEATEELMIVVNFLAYAFIALDGRNININLFERYMSKSVQTTIRILGYALGVVAIGATTWGAFLLLQRNIIQHIGKPYLANIFHFPLWPGSLVLFIGSCFWLLAFILLLTRESVKAFKE